MEEEEYGQIIGLGNIKPEVKPITQGLTNQRLGEGRLNTTHNEEDFMSSNQSSLEMVGNFIARVVPNTILQTIETASYLGDVEQLVNKLKGDEQEYSNWLAKAMQEAKGVVDENFKTFKTTDAQTGFAPGDFSWWMDQTPDTVSSMLSLLLPAMATGGLTTAVGRVAGLGARAGMAAETAMAAEGGLKLLSDVSATVVSRHAESTMEAGQTFNESYQTLVDQGVSDEEARQRAGDAASKVYNTNWAFAIQDFIALRTLSKGLKSYAQGTKGTSIKELIAQPFLEGAEEAGQYIVSQEATKSAIEETDYFGEGFNSRIGDYVQDPNFKASVVQGMLGGAAMTGSGFVAERAAAIGGAVGSSSDYIKDKFRELTKSGLRKEKANYEGNTGNSMKEDQRTFSEQVFEHLENDKLGWFKSAIDAQAKDPSVDPEAKHLLKDQADDVEFVAQESAKIKSNSVVPKELHQKLLETKLQQRQEARIHYQLDKELLNLYTEAEKNKEILPDHIQLKQLQMTAIGYTQLAATNPTNTYIISQAKKANNAYTEAKKSISPELWDFSYPGKSIDEVLTLSSDNEIAQKSFQLVSTNEKINDLKTDINKFSTPKGVASLQTEKQAKTELSTAATLVAKPDVTSSELLEAINTVKTPEARTILQAKVNELKQVKKEVNKENIDTYTDELDLLFGAQEQLPDETAATVALPDADAELQSQLDEVIDKDVASEWKLPKQADPIVVKVNQETITSPVITVEAEVATKKREIIFDYSEVSLAKTWNARFESIKNEDGSFREFARTADGELKAITWHGPNGAVANTSTVFASTEQGIPLIDTPIVKNGDSVLLVVENNFQWKVQAGYIPDVSNMDRIIVNVYHSDKEGNKLNPKPIAQLDNGDSTSLDPDQKANNRALRIAVDANGGSIVSTIENKVTGIIRRSPAGKLNSLEVLESDWYNGKVQKTPYNPIMLTVIGGKLNFGEIGQLPGELQSELLAIQNRMSTVDLQSMSGFTATVRRNPVGELQLETLVARTLNEAEAEWVKSALPSAFAADSMKPLLDVINIPFKMAGSEYPQGNKKKLMYGSGKLHIPTQDGWITIGPKDYSKILTGELPGLEALNGALANTFKNINSARNNDPARYIDPILGEQPNYYTALKASGSLTTKLLGSVPGAQGTENSYSFVQSTVYINPKPVITKVTVENDIITDSTIPVVAPPNEATKITEPGKKLTEAERKKNRRERLKPSTQGNFRAITDKEFHWLSDKLGPEFLKVMHNLDRFLSNNGREAFGSYYKGLVTIARNAEEGTAYHEFGHFFLDPINGLITKLEKDRLLAQASIAYNISAKSPRSIEEAMMRDFEAYMVSGGRVKPKAERATSFFSRLWQMIKSLLGLQGPLEKLFRGIDNVTLTQAQVERIVAAHKIDGDTSPIFFKKLPGFEYVADQAAAVNTITSNLVNSAYQAAKDRGIDIGEIFKETIKDGSLQINGLENLFKAQQQVLVEDFNRIKLINGDDRSDNDIDRYTVYHAMGVASLAGLPTDQVEELYKENIGEWSDVKDSDGIIVRGFKDKILRDFSRFGFTVIPGVNDVFEDGDSEVTEASRVQEEDQGEHISDQNIMQVSPIKSLSATLKLWLNSISVPATDENNKVVGTVKDLFGNDIKLSFAEVDRNLQIKLADSPDVLVKLEELSSIDPFMKVVYDKLMIEKDSNSKLFTEFMVKYKLNTIDTQTILQDNRLGETKVIDSNRDSAYLSLVDTWKDKGLRSKVITTNGEHSKNIFSKIEKDLANFKTLSQAANKKGQKLSYEDLKRQFVESFGLVKIDFTPSFWQEHEATFTALENKSKPDQKALSIEYDRLRKELWDWLYADKANSLTSAVSSSLKSDTTPFYDQPIVRELAKIDGKFVKSEGGHMYVAADYTQRFPINLPSFITEFNVIIQNDPATYVEEKRRDPLLATNRVLNAVNNKQSNSKVRVVEIEATQEKGRDAKMFSDRSAIDSIKARLSSFFINAQNEDAKTPMGIFYLPTPADKSKSQALQLPRKKDADARIFLKEVMLDTVKYEAHRIGILRKYDGVRERYNYLRTLTELGEAEVAELSDLAWIEKTPLLNDVKNIKNKNAQGDFDFKYFPELNNNVELKSKLTARLTDGDINSEEYLSALPELEAYIDNFIENQYQGFVTYMLDQSLLRVVGTKLKNSKIPKGLFSKPVEKNGKVVYEAISEPTEAQIHSLLKDFFFNDTAWQLEMSKLFMGDIALYSSDVDYFKRAYQLVTPGYSGYSNEPISMNRMIFSSQIKRDGEIYNKVDKADAQTYATIEAFREIAKSVGQWPTRADEVFNISWGLDIPASVGIKNQLKAETNAARSGEISEEESQNRIKAAEAKAKELRTIANNIITTASKPFQFNDRELVDGDGRSMFIKEQVKDSIAPLFPELYHYNNPKHKGLKDLATFMRANGVQLASDESTTKVGLYGATDLSRPLEKWQIRETKLSDIRFPQLLPSKVKTEASGSQFHKLVVGDIQDEVTYVVDNKSITGSELKAKYNELWVDKLAAASVNLQEQLGIGADFKYSTEPKKFNKQILRLEEFIRKELISRDLDENYLETLKLVKTLAEKIDFNVPLSFIQFGDRIQGILTNIFKREIIKVKSPGYVAVNMADFGMGYSDELKFVTNKDGKVEAAEIGLSIDYLSDVGLEPAKHYDINGRIYWDKLSREQQKALEFIAYRIPTSSKSSMLPVRIAVVLPVQMSNFVLIPGELTSQMGLDFDVDKTQLLRRVLTDEGKIDKDNTDNKLFDLYWSILTSPAHFNEMTQPLNTDTLEEIERQLNAVGAIPQSSWSVFTMPANVTVEEKNKGEKVKVGVNSQMATMHSVLTNVPEEYKPRAKFGISINGITPSILGQRLNSSGQLISGLLGETLQAALDAAKKPLLALFNINKAYMASFESMIMAGYPLHTAVHFFMQPVVKEYIKMYNQENGSERVALESLFKKYKKLEVVYRKIEKQATDARVEGGYYRPDVRSEDFEAALTGQVEGDETYSALILYEFMQNAVQARTLSNMSAILSVDTLNDLTSIEALQSFIHKINKLTTFKEGSINFPASLLDFETAPPTTKRIAAFIKYAIKDAREFVRQFFPSVDYTEHHKFIANQLNMSDITDVKTLKVINQFTNYFALNQNDKLRLTLQETHPLASINQASPTNNIKPRWSITAKELDDSIIGYMDKTVKEVNRPDITNNKVIKTLKQRPNKDGIVVIGLINTSSDKNKTDLINDFDELLHDEDIRVRTLGHDLARWAIQTSGMSFSTASFVNIIPVSFFVENGLGEHWRNKVATDSFDLDKEALLLNLVRNKADSIKYFPELFNEELMVPKSQVQKTYDDTKVVERFTMKKEAFGGKETGPRYYLYKDNLYEADTMSPTNYKLLQRSGERFLTQISGNGRHNSSINRLGAPDPWDTQSGLVPSSIVEKRYNLEGLENEASEINEEIMKYLPDGSSTTTVLEQLLEEETDLQTKEVIDVLLRNKDKINTAIKVQETPGKFGEFVVTETETGVSSVININPYAGTTSDVTTRRVLLHEILHAYTVGVLQNATTPEEVNFVRNVKRLTEDARKSLGSVQGTQNEYEFIAELASNKEFRNKLRKNDFWSRVLRQLRNLFGLKDAFDRTLDELYLTLDRAEGLQALSASEFALEQAKEKPKVNKITSLFDKIIVTLDGERRALQRIGDKDGGKKLFDKVKRLTAIGKNNQVTAKVAYFAHVKKEQSKIETKTAELLKGIGAGKKLNTGEVRRMRNQLLSYSDLLNDLYFEFAKMPAEEFISLNISREAFMKDASVLRDAMSSLSRDIQGLAEEAAWQFAKTYMPDMNREDFIQNLRIADRDISWWSRMTRSGIDIIDPVIQASTMAVQSVIRGAHKKLNELLYAEESTQHTANIAYKALATDDQGNVLVTPPGEKDKTEWKSQKIAYLRTGKVKAMNDYLAWRGNSSTIRDKYAPVIDPASFKADSEEISFISPFSPRGQEILSFDSSHPDYSLRQFYETFVIDYLASQEAIKLRSERPGLRLPTVSKSLLEGVIGVNNAKGLGELLKEKVLANFTERSDEQEYATVNQHLEPENKIIIRFTAKHDGQDGRFKADQISLDVVATTLLFQNEMLKRDGLQKIQADLENNESFLKERKVIETKRKDFLSSEEQATIQNDGLAGFKTMEGASSNTYAFYQDFLQKFLYGKRRKKQKGARILDTLTSLSGLNIMMGNVAIPLTNAFMGNYALFTEGIGGNIIDRKNLAAGYRLYKNQALTLGKDFGKRVKDTQFGKLLGYFNPLERTEGFQSISINGTFVRESFNLLAGSGGSIVENELAVVVMGAVMDRYKAVDAEGKEVAFNEAVEIDNTGKLSLKKGFTYEGKTKVTNEQVDKILHNVIKLYHVTSGVYNDLDTGMSKRDMWGRAIGFMRNWLPAGLDARYRRLYNDPRLGGQKNEGQYVSAAIAFKTLYGNNGYFDGTLKSIRMLSWFGEYNAETLLLPHELELSSEEKQEIIALRKANIRKTLFQLYTVAVLTAVGMFAFDEDDDSYLVYMMARVKREIMTFGDPITAWEVLRSPSILMQTVKGLYKATGETASAAWDISLGDGEVDIRERGKAKGMPKWLYEGSKVTGTGALFQFEDLGVSTRLINDGGFR